MIDMGQRNELHIRLDRFLDSLDAEEPAVAQTAVTAFMMMASADGLATMRAAAVQIQRQRADPSHEPRLS